MSNVWDLLEHNADRNDEYRKSFAEFKKRQKVFFNVSYKFDLKTGDIIQFWTGYNDDILASSEVMGFDENGKAYMLWSCWWFAIDLNKVFVKKIKES